MAVVNSFLMMDTIIHDAVYHSVKNNVHLKQILGKTLFQITAFKLVLYAQFFSKYSILFKIMLKKVLYIKRQKIIQTIKY
jgi:hypothetical protein